MKKLMQILFSIFFATTISLPADAMVTPNGEGDDVTDEQTTNSIESDSYQLAFIMGDFGLHQTSAGVTSRFESPVIFVSDPAGKIVKDAQVVTTIIDTNGRHMMCLAHPFKSGYLLPTHHLLPGRYRVEAEVITNGSLLTDEFRFVKA
jgi:hypothetical protein